jgi:colanic acid/amylovoran biosynthesis glycosyltransferase
MKIAFVVGKFPVLSETFIFNQIIGLIEQGHDVDIYSKIKPNYEKTHQDVEKYHLLNRTFYLTMPQNRIKRLIKAFYLFGINIHKGPICILSTLNILKYGRAVISLHYFYLVLPFLGKRYDIVHCHFGPNGNLGIRLRKLGAIECKIITSFHGYDVNEINSRQYYTELFKNGDAFTVNTEFTKRRILSLGAPNDRVNILPVGLEIEKYEYKKRVTSDRSVKVVTVARLVEKKGIQYSIKAVANVIMRKPRRNIHYNIAGDGPLRDELESLITELNMGDKIKLLGWLDQDEIRELYRKADIFVLSSVTAKNGDKEGQGLVLQEAQAVGLPVISTLHNGIPEGVLDGKTGFLVPEKDVETLADRIAYLIENPEDRIRMGRAGRKFVQQNYDIKKLNQRLLSIYEQLINNNGDSLP